MRKPRMLDLFCGAGGASVGYDRAGFEVVGVDLHAQPRYPFEFHQADAMTYPLDGFDVVHASPPCQAYSVATNGSERAHVDLLAACRDRLAATGLPWVIENVPGAPMRADYVLCGSHFGMRIVRHRWFETSWHAYHLAPSCAHHPDAVSIAGHSTPSWSRKRRAALGLPPNVGADELREIMGISWMNRDELSQSIPPAYAEWIGRQLLATLDGAVTLP